MMKIPAFDMVKIDIEGAEGMVGGGQGMDVGGLRMQGGGRGGDA